MVHVRIEFLDADDHFIGFGLLEDGLWSGFVFSRDFEPVFQPRERGEDFRLQGLDLVKHGLETAVSFVAVCDAG